jgi:hypothetical protein
MRLTYDSPPAIGSLKLQGHEKLPVNCTGAVAARNSAAVGDRLIKPFAEEECCSAYSRRVRVMRGSDVETLPRVAGLYVR